VPDEIFCARFFSQAFIETQEKCISKEALPAFALPTALAESRGRLRFRAPSAEVFALHRAQRSEADSGSTSDLFSNLNAHSLTAWS
jgi:hypothetical protein